MIQKYRKKPVVIEAEQFQGVLPFRGVSEGEFYSDPADIGGRRLVKWFYVTTIHGQKTKVIVGDWIIPEPDGIHFYPCKPDIFEKTYELVDNQEKKSI